MYKNPAATRVTAENCPRRIILDEASTSIAEVMAEAIDQFRFSNCLAYIWRPSAEIRTLRKKGALQKVFEPFARCLPHYMVGSSPSNLENYRFDLSSEFHQFAADSNGGLKMRSSRYGIEPFFSRDLGAKKIINHALISGGDGCVEYFSGRDFLSTLLDSQIKAFYLDSAAKPHSDGVGRPIQKDIKNDFTRSISFRALEIVQGPGTFFWGETPDQLGEMNDVWVDSMGIINPEYLIGKKVFQLATGDLVIFENGARHSSQCFIHQAPMGDPLDLENFSIDQVRMLAIHDMESLSLAI